MGWALPKLSWCFHTKIIINSNALTPQGQLSLQGTFGVWTDVQVLWTKADEGELGMYDVEFSQLSYEVNDFWKFRKFFIRRVLSFIKNVPGRLRSELGSSWGVKSDESTIMVVRESPWLSESHRRWLTGFDAVELRNSHLANVH